jgi:hypothetical protein
MAIIMKIACEIIVAYAAPSIHISGNQNFQKIRIGSRTTLIKVEIANNLVVVKLWPSALKAIMILIR